jgi:hypothetical protein
MLNGGTGSESTEQRCLHAGAINKRYMQYVGSTSIANGLEGKRNGLYTSQMGKKILVVQKPFKSRMPRRVRA